MNIGQFAAEKDFLLFESQRNISPDQRSAISEAYTTAYRRGYQAAVKNRSEINKRIDLSEWPETPSEDVLDEWLKHRKRKKASVSKIVLKRFGEQLKKAKEKGYSVDDCLLICLDRGWTGFEAAWLPDKGAPTDQPPHPLASQIVEAYNATVSYHKIMVVTPGLLKNISNIIQTFEKADNIETWVHHFRMLNAKYQSRDPNYLPNHSKLEGMTASADAFGKSVNDANN